MQRRTVLRLLSVALVPGAVGRAAVAAGQVSSPRSVPTRWVPAETPGARASDVKSGDIRIGMSAPFTGPAAGLGTEFYRGAQAYYDEVNAGGGVHGRALKVIALDDAAEPLSCVRNTIQLLEKDRVFCLSNYMGTPTLMRALPVIRRHADRHVVLVGNFTGAQPQRETPYIDHVFNIRASYRQEMAALVDRFWAVGARSIGVFSQADAYGRSGTDGVTRALAARGARVAAETTYQRGARFNHDVGPAVDALRRAGVDAVLCTGAYQACGALVRTARDLGWTVPISNVSFVGSDAMLRLLVQHGRRTGHDYTRALVNSQVVPSYDDVALPGVVEYRGLMDRHDPPLPVALRDDRYVPQRYSLIGLEGYLSARVVVEAVRRAGPHPTRSGFRQALESLQGLDLGIGAAVSFGPERHQGLDRVYFTRVEAERWVPVTDWTSAVQA